MIVKWETNMNEWAWHANYDGKELDFPEIAVVGYYTKEIELYGDENKVTIAAFIDNENGKVLDIWIE